MIPNNNFSVLPWYRSIDEQNAKKWWVYGRVYPLFTPAGFMPTWQIYTEQSNYALLFDIINANTGEQVVRISSSNFASYGITRKDFSDGMMVWSYPAIVPIANEMENGRYYIHFYMDEYDLISDVFTVVNDIQPYLKLEWWDEADFVMDAGVIAYDGTFRNILYLDSNIAKPEYPFEEEGESRDGYFFPIKQISEKRYRFNFLAPEYLLDVLRFVRMADHVQVTKGNNTYSVDTILLTPEWQADGDLAVVSTEFDTATVAKKIGVGYIRALRGDFNDDFNNDFNNQ